MEPIITENNMEFLDKLRELSKTLPQKTENRPTDPIDSLANFFECVIEAQTNKDKIFKSFSDLITSSLNSSGVLPEEKPTDFTPSSRSTSTPKPIPTPKPSTSTPTDDSKVFIEIQKPSHYTPTYDLTVEDIIRRLDAQQLKMQEILFEMKMLRSKLSKITIV